MRFPNMMILVGALLSAVAAPADAEVWKAGIPISGEMAANLVKVAIRSAGQEGDVHPPVRSLPACDAPPSVAPFQGRWSAVVLSCASPKEWTRVLRTGVSDIVAEDSEAHEPRQLPTVLTAVRNLRRGEILQADDVLLAQAAGVDAAQALVDVESVVGRHLRVALAAGQPVLERQLERRLDVEEGKRVIVTFRTQGLEVATEGIALSSGEIGEILTVRILSSGALVEGRIEGDRQVIIRTKL